MTVTEALQFRRAIPSFSHQPIERAEILRLIELANLAPSSMNLQPWEVIVCDQPEDLALLQSVSFNQKKISEASAAIIVLGNLHHFLHAAEIADAAVANGSMPAEKRDSWITAAHSGWKDRPDAQRDEAFRGSMLWAMSFMLVASEAGWDTAPMGGFQPAQLSEVFQLPDHLIPTLIICIGQRNPEIEIRPRGMRFSAESIAHFGKYSAELGNP